MPLVKGKKLRNLSWTDSELNCTHRNENTHTQYTFIMMNSMCNSHCLENTVTCSSEMQKHTVLTTLCPFEVRDFMNHVTSTSFSWLMVCCCMTSFTKSHFSYLSPDVPMHAIGSEATNIKNGRCSSIISHTEMNLYLNILCINVILVSLVRYLTKLKCDVWHFSEAYVFKQPVIYDHICFPAHTVWFMNRSDAIVTNYNCTQSNWIEVMECWNLKTNWDTNSFRTTDFNIR